MPPCSGAGGSGAIMWFELLNFRPFYEFQFE
jgi:hypothetical protein